MVLPQVHIHWCVHNVVTMETYHVMHLGLPLLFTALPRHLQPFFLLFFVLFTVKEGWQTALWTRA